MTLVNTPTAEAPGLYELRNGYQSGKLVHAKNI